MFLLNEIVENVTKLMRRKNPFFRKKNLINELMKINTAIIQLQL